MKKETKYHIGTGIFTAGILATLTYLVYELILAIKKVDMEGLVANVNNSPLLMLFVVVLVLAFAYAVAATGLNLYRVLQIKR